MIESRQRRAAGDARKARHVTDTWNLREPVRADLEAIWVDTVEQWGVEQAERYLKGLFTCFDDLAENPQPGRQRDEPKPGYRSFLQATVRRVRCDRAFG